MHAFFLKIPTRTEKQSTKIRSGGMYAARRKILKNRLRFGKNFSFLSDFLAVRFTAQENLHFRKNEYSFFRQAALAAALF